MFAVSLPETFKQQGSFNLKKKEKYELDPIIILQGALRFHKLELCKSSSTVQCQQCEEKTSDLFCEDCELCE